MLSYAALQARPLRPTFSDKCWAFYNTHKTLCQISSVSVPVGAIVAAVALVSLMNQ